MNKNRKVCRQNQATGVTPKFLVIQGFWNRAGNNTFKQGPSINLSRMLLRACGAMLTKRLMHSLI